MGNSCLWRPNKGQETFAKLKNLLGYKKAWEIFGISEGQEFQRDYKDTLTFDSEGIPTFESLIENEYIQSLVGDEVITKINSNKFPAVEDTLSNYDSLLTQALNYNNGNNKYVAVIDITDDGKLKINLYPKTQKNIDNFKNQYGVYKLNQRILQTLKKAGITLEMLSDLEVRNGRNGLTQFIAAQGLAQDAITLIKIANNIEGVNALSEEFSHLLIDALSDRPIIQRSINALSNNPKALESILGEEFNDLIGYYDGNMEAIAEEALGQMLHQGLLTNAIEAPKENKSLFDRMINYIKNLFKGEQLDSFVKDIANIQSEMDNIAKEYLAGDINITNKMLNRNNRTISFNSLSDRIDRNIKILREATEVEAKRALILKEKETEVTEKINQLERYMAPRADTALGIMTYAQNCLEALQGTYDEFLGMEALDTADKFHVLQSMKTILQSYGGFINRFSEALVSEESEDDNMFNGDFEVKTSHGKVTVNVKEVFDGINTLNRNIASAWNLKAVPLFIQYIEETLGKETVDFIKKECGGEKAIEALLMGSPNDISMMDLWLDSMRDSSNTMLQIFDRLVKTANDKARARSYNIIKELEALREYYKAQGLDDFEFMFEVDSEGNKSGNYIDTSVNRAEFNRQLHLKNKELLEKYPKDSDKRREERNKWISDNGYYDDNNVLQPLASKYPGTKLSGIKLEAYNRIIELKQQLDSLYPASRTQPLKAIQVRKNGIQRLIDSSHSPKEFFDNYKEALAASFLERGDDDAEYGNVSGLTNFDGSEFMTLPVLYTNRLKNPNEISTDVLGTMMAYAVSTTKYDELKKIIAPLETGRTIVHENLGKNVQETNGNKHVRETFEKFGIKVDRIATKNELTNLEKKLNIFLESQLYQRHIKDEGTLEVLGLQLKKSKAGKALLQMNSMAQLGFNWLANTANVTQGLAMQNIEMAGGQFFNRSTLFKADKEFASQIGDVILDINARNKTSFLNLFDEFLDIKQDFSDKFRDQRNSFVKRLFGKNIAFLGQEAGDFWLYNRAAISHCMEIEVNYKGSTMSFYDFLKNYCVQERKINGKSTGVKEIVIPQGVKTTDGKVVDRNFTNMVSREIADINQTCFGIYNTEDAVAANRTVLGMAITQYRKWMVPAYNNRFQKRITNLDTLSMKEGYYRTSYRFAKEVIRDLKKGEFNMLMVYNKLKPEEKRNVLKTIMEVVQFLAVAAIVKFAPWPDDDEETLEAKGNKASKAEYAMVRLKSELGVLVPGLTMINDSMKVAKSPAAVLGTLNSITTFVGSVFDYEDWITELQSGQYKGHSKLYRNFMRLPIPPMTILKQLNRWNFGIDSAIQYYVNPVSI